MTKIKSITITGIRGVKEKLLLQLDKRSILLFGENGTGKSSITDALEWFYKEKIEHLSGEEVGTKSALRNIFLNDAVDGKVEIICSNKNFDNEKTITKSLSIWNSNVSSEFLKYVKDSLHENLILRYRDLIQFISATKATKLSYLQGIIGFAEVRNMRALLRKMSTKYAREIKAAGFHNRKSILQSTLLQCLGQNIVSSKQFFTACSKLIEPLKLKKISSYDDARSVLKSIEEIEDVQQIEQIALLNKIAGTLIQLEASVAEIAGTYESYYKTFTELKKDAEKLTKLQLLKLLIEGLNVLKKDIVDGDYCPICQQEKSKVSLIRELNERIADLEELEEEQTMLKEQASDLNTLLQTTNGAISSLLKEKLLEEKSNDQIARKLKKLKISIDFYSQELKRDILSKEELTDPDKLTIDKKALMELAEQSKKKAKEFLDSQRANIRVQVAVKLSTAIEAYLGHRRLAKEEQILTNRQITFDALYSDFIRRQEDALHGFLKLFSDRINNYYNLMNPGEKVKDIQLVPIKDRTGEELEGITIEFKFFDKRKGPPTALLSESHINCLGIAFFLASVKAFNKANQFFVLDDVISSFDSNHRARFIRLLIEEFDDYQIILLTHEKDFFDIASSEGKRKNWLVNSLSWTAEKGTCFETPISDLKVTIQQKIKNRNTDGLGNDIRKYGERQLKQIANNIEAKVAFRFNDQNEERMLSELLTAVQGTINKHSPTDLKNKNNIANVLASPLLIANRTSHDSKFKEDFGDLQLFWDDIKQLIRTFYCNEEKCKGFVSTKFYDTAKSQIRCKCGKLCYDWKK